jgi:hypothetical protein
MLKSIGSRLGCSLACALLAFVPGSRAQNSHPASPRLQSKADESGRQSDGRTSVVGCMFVQDGKYVLMTQKSIIELIIEGNQQAVVSHKVKVTGVFVSTTIAQANSQPDNKTDGRTTSDERTSNQIGERAKLRVLKVKILSSSCDIKSEKKPTSLGRVYSTCTVAIFRRSVTG